jgi:hypothetical protein
MAGIRVRRRGSSSREAGYMLLILMLAVAVLTIMMLNVSTNYRRSIVRDREVEMIHRGVQYERAVQLYYRKFGRYPISIEQLEDTNKIRFLRKEYKDPMSPDGKWKIVHITDIKLSGASTLAAAAGGAVPGGTAAATTGQSTLSSGTGAATGSDNQPVAGSGTGGSGPADANGSSGNGPVLGGGPMLGVVSQSKAEGIHSFNDQSHYNEWYFIYDPSQDRPGLQLTGPWNPKLALGASTTSTATPTGQAGSTGAPGLTAPSGTAPTAPVPTTNAP